MRVKRDDETAAISALARNANVAGSHREIPQCDRTRFSIQDMMDLGPVYAPMAQTSRDRPRREPAGSMLLLRCAQSRGELLGQSVDQTQRVSRVTLGIGHDHVVSFAGGTFD